MESGAGAESRIRELVAGITTESVVAIDREILLGLLDWPKKPEAARTHWAAAVSFIEELQKRGIRTFDRKNVELHWALALAERKNGNPAAALEHVGRVTPETDGVGIDLAGFPKPGPASELVLFEAELNEQANQWPQAAKLYGSVVEKGTKSNRILFAWARAIEKSGEKPRARTIYKQVAESAENDFWKEQAGRRLASDNQGGSK
jgi:thioredoxin-like negative regulator of GroEL